MKIEHIVCPVDFSPASINAYEFAAHLARVKNSTLHLTHVYEKPYYSVAAPSGSGAITYAVDSTEDTRIRREIELELQKLTEFPFAKGLTVYGKLISDTTTWRFFEELDAEKADVIVMGTRGATGLLHGGIIGTNTERVIRHAPIPVISVPDLYVCRPIKKILFATDFSAGSLSVFPHVADLAKLLGAVVVVGMVNTRENFATSRYAKEGFEKLSSAHANIHMSLVVQNYITIEEGIWEMCNTEGADLIAMQTHGRTGIAHLVRGSIAEELSSTSFITVPLMTIKSE